MIDRKLLNETVKIAAEYFEKIESRHVGPVNSVKEIRDKLSMGLPEEGEDPVKVIQDMATKVDGGLVASPGPRYFGFVTGGVVPASLAADWMTSVWDQNGVLSVSSPAAGVVEEIVSNWILELLRFPTNCSVGMVTGCQMANFTCLAAARHEVLRRVGWDVESKGLNGAPEISIVAGEEAHATLINALKMLGFGTDNIIQVPSDSNGAMIPKKLKEALEDIDGPLIVNLQAGNVNTGAFDPFKEIIDVAHEKGAWVHVDGAFGLWGRVTPELGDELEGVEKADSWATDAHKWLNVPYDSGLAIVANEAAHRTSMALKAPYYIAASDETRDPSQWVPESSRRARGFALYGAIRSLGGEGIREIVERNCRQARLMASLLEEDPAIEILNEVILNQVLVHFLPPEGIGSGAFNGEVISVIQEEGTCWAGSSRWKGMDAMRVSVSNWSTTDKDINISASAIRKVLAECRERHS